MAEQVEVGGEVTKRGDRYVIYGLHRGYHKPGRDSQGNLTGEPSTAKSFIGATLSVKALPLLEDFLKSLGSGEKQPVDAFGKQWAHLPGEPELKVYELSKTLSPLSNISLELPGQSLEFRDKQTLGGKMIINLSFLRLVGISDGAGLTIGLKDVYTKEDLIKLHNDLGRAMKLFCDEFLCPVDLTCTISSYQTR